MVMKSAKTPIKKCGGSPTGQPIDPQKWGGLEPSGSIGVYAYVFADLFYAFSAVAPSASK